MNGGRETQTQKEDTASFSTAACHCFSVCCLCPGIFSFFSFQAWTTRLEPRLSKIEQPCPRIACDGIGDGFLGSIGRRKIGILLQRKEGRLLLSSSSSLDCCHFSSRINPVTIVHSFNCNPQSFSAVRNHPTWTQIQFASWKL